MPTFSHKIDEWMKEAETRPESAVTIVRLVAKRLNELTARNEELLSENIALQNGTRVEEYQKRIAHLEYQLDLLKRRFGSEETLLTELPSASVEASTLSLLIYNTYGRILRVELNSDGHRLGRILDETLPNSEQPRLLVVPSNEEVLLLFTSGRVSTCAVSNITTVECGNDWRKRRYPMSRVQVNFWFALCPSRGSLSLTSLCRSAAAVA